jgi:hypothetical protein
MTSSVVITQANTQLLITEENGNEVVAMAPSAPSIVLSAEGPQGAAGPQGPVGPAGPAGLVVNDVAKVDKSVVYYDANTAMFKADNTWTTDTLVDGTNF